MNMNEIVALLQIISVILDQLGKLIESLKAAGVDVSGVKLHTGVPLDLSTLFHLGKP